MKPTRVSRRVDGSARSGSARPAPLAAPWPLRTAAIAAAAIAALAFASPGWSQDPPGTRGGGRLDWARMSAEQRAVLAPLARDWASIDEARREKWLEVVARYPKMPPDEQQRIQARMAEWARMTPAERGSARLGFQETRQVAPGKLQERWEMYQTLPPEARKVLAERQRPPAPAVTRPPTAASAPSIATAQPKDNTVPLPPVTSGAVLRPVAPTVVQVAPGATTTLMTRPAAAPAHQHPGQPKILARPGDVDPATLLPRVGPQAAPPGRPAASAAR